MLLKNNNPLFFSGLVIGGLVGASLALLLAPQPGKDTRTQIRNKSFKLKDQTMKKFQNAGHRTQEQMAVWQERGKETLEKRKQRAVKAIGHGKDRVIEAIGHRKDNLMHSIRAGQETMAETAASEVEQPI